MSLLSCRIFYILQSTLYERCWWTNKISWFAFSLLSNCWSYGWSRFTAAGQMHNQAPPPYQPPQPYSLHATVAHSYGIQHMIQNSTREVMMNLAIMLSVIIQIRFFRCINLSFFQLQSMSPASGTGMSPSYPHSEPSCDYTMLVGNNRSLQRPSSNSPPLTPQSQNVTSLSKYIYYHKLTTIVWETRQSWLYYLHTFTIAVITAVFYQSKWKYLMHSAPHFYFLKFLLGDSNTPQTLMGQFMEALNPQPNLDDLNINLEPFQGGLDCNVDEVRRLLTIQCPSTQWNFCFN